MKKLYDKNLVETLNSDMNPPYNLLLNYLEGDDFEQKHFALTFINSLQKPQDIKFFLDNIIDQDTKIRELASFRTNDFIMEDNNLMQYLDERPNTILRTICDVNPQVCRNICALLPLSTNKEFLKKEILKKIRLLLEDTKTIRVKTHKVSKDIFNLYWNFFALEFLIDENFGNIENIEDILLACSRYKDFTIRERAAFIIKKLQEAGINLKTSLIAKYKNDSNFYVKKAIEIN